MDGGGRTPETKPPPRSFYFETRRRAARSDERRLTAAGSHGRAVPAPAAEVTDPRRFTLVTVINGDNIDSVV